MDIRKNIFWIAPISVMAIGLLPMPYGYYNLSRLTVCVCAIYFCLKLFQKNNTVFLWVFGLLAVLYNPIMPVRLYDKEIWIVVNAITAFLFFIKRDEAG